eukprot:TRINITY_DN10161_c0_g1_i1.p1 TRINITY_DN10161_c0_g1~~TRINITY_DN10161_c0_g1_i1.p1  ORF type:complete len:411 (+),score=46.93 TRINITY_DN10161_c0_g1_i1:129-1361(+)
MSDGLLPAAKNNENEKSDDRPSAQKRPLNEIEESVSDRVISEWGMVIQMNGGEDDGKETKIPKGGRKVQVTTRKFPFAESEHKMIATWDAYLGHTKNTDAMWLTDTAAIQSQSELNLSHREVRICAARRLAQIMSGTMYKLPQSQVAEMIKAYNAQPKILNISAHMKIPPRIVMRYVLAHKGVECTRSMWDRPKEHLDPIDAEQMAIASTADTATCSESMWEKYEKLELTEKVLIKWAKLKGLTITPREQISGSPSPSLLCSDLTVDDKPVKWITVSLLYGLNNSEVNKLITEQVKGLESRFGGGIVIMPFGYEPGFGADWAKSFVKMPSELEIVLGYIEIIFDIDLLNLRSTFDRSLLHINPNTVSNSVHNPVQPSIDSSFPRILSTPTSKSPYKKGARGTGLRWTSTW